MHKMYYLRWTESNTPVEVTLVDRRVALTREKPKLITDGEWAPISEVHEIQVSTRQYEKGKRLLVYPGQIDTSCTPHLLKK